MYDARMTRERKGDVMGETSSLSESAIDGYRKAAARLFMDEEADPADVQLAYDIAVFKGAIEWGDITIVAFDIDNQLVILGGS